MCSDAPSAAQAARFQALLSHLLATGEMRLSFVENFTFAELFAGIGGFRVGLQALGGRCVFASEISEACCDAYRRNFPQGTDPVLRGDICFVDAADIPDHDMLVGGFPCQPFSAAGSQPGLQDAQRGQLYLEIARILREKRPRAFLLENVPGLLECDEGRTFEIIRKAFEVGGAYTVTVEAVNARNLTAQNRNRLYFVGILTSGFAEGHRLFDFPWMPNLNITFGDIAQSDAAIGGQGECVTVEDYTVKERQFERLRSSSKKKGDGGSENAVNRLLLRNLMWHERKSGTLISHYGCAVSRGNSLLVPRAFPHNPRLFTVRECARLMGFPDDSYDPGSPVTPRATEAWIFTNYRMLGNAVCPPVICALGGALLQALNWHRRPETILSRELLGADWADVGRALAVRLAVQQSSTL
eukprot:gnl/MRDRNA2_/MRDRNA2_16806_c0_seq1.p1 gnl/MRDRNA2_/MRDRNA2_16806_c0~~gnl/MRDRNA2_/MRDRNA2_16806_c0_seq1.p1  ORF type:complete len:413 (-),score=23.99 gnl/MRDRNA2_/MRDRNA2_16806_c0_seq1:315-1553(-)